MTTIKNVQPLSSEDLFSLLKSDFAPFVNAKLDSNLEIDYQRVYDIINVLFPEVIEGIAFTITVNDDELTISTDVEGTEYNSELLEKHLIEFLTEKAG